MCVRCEVHIHSRRHVLPLSHAHMHSDSVVYSHICSVSFSLSLMFPVTLFPPLCKGRLRVVLQKKASLNIYICAALERFKGALSSSFPGPHFYVVSLL